MTDTLDLFSIVDAERARDEAIARADKHANEQWKDAAHQAVVYCASKCTFTTDDVWRHLTTVHPDLTTHEPRAMGAVMKAAQRAGYIEPTDRFVNSERTSCHRSPIRVWHSLLSHFCERAA